MNPEWNSSYIGYEYKEISVARRELSLCLDCYENFGWTMAKDSPIPSGKNTVTIQLKRNRKLLNRMELTRLQRHFEFCIQEIHRMERSKQRTATLWAVLTGLVGTACMAGAVFAVTSEPPRYLLMLLLSVPAFAGWICPVFLYRHTLEIQTRKLQPLIEAKYEEIDQLCEKGHSLL